MNYRAFWAGLSVLGCALSAMGGSYVEEPTSCLERNVHPCYVASKYSPVVIEQKKVKFWLSAESSIELEADAVKLLSGDMMIQSTTAYAFETGLIRGTSNGNVWVAQDSRVANASSNVVNLSGGLTIENKLDQGRTSIPPGFENWYSLRAGSSGVPRPAEANSLKSRFFALFGSLSTDLETQFANWSQGWKENTELASAQYSGMVERNIASLRERQEEAQRRKERREKENAYFRRMYRQRNLPAGPTATGESPDPGAKAN